MKFNFEQMNETSLVYTGGVTTTSAPNSPSSVNAYHRLAKTMQNDANLRDNILSPTFKQMDFTLSPTGSSMSIRESIPEAVQAAEATPAP